ncbi:MAG: hypothetical protein JO032_07320, partial [Alphaproteobacteria bacterium]|nr:hypothetical protein [Alphaproteobacteria bacterium]
MTLQPRLRTIAVAGALLTATATIDAAVAAGADQLKSDIDSFLRRLQLVAPGRLHWDGAESIDVGDSGGGATAKLANARFSIRKDPGDAAAVATITLDRIEIRERPAPAGDDITEVTVTLPNATVTTPTGEEVHLTVDGGKATVTLQGDAERQRDVGFEVAAARIAAKDHPGSVSLGPVSGSWKTVRNGDGSWRGPLALDLNRIAFALPDAQIEGSVGRIAYSGETGGPSLAELDAFRDRATEIRDNFQHDPEKRTQEMLALLPKVFSVFSYSNGNASVERVVAKRPGGETLVALDKAWIGGGIEGFDRDKASFRLTLGHAGLSLAPSVLDENRVPRSVDLDFGVEDIAVAVLRSIAEAAAQGGPEADQEDRQKAFRQMLGASMALQPVLRVYDAMVTFKSAAIAASGEARRAPPPPLGYEASGDITVRGFDALGDIDTAQFDRTFLPLIKFLGSPATAADGAAVLTYHLSGALGQPLKLNGSDIGGWFGGTATHPPAPLARALRLEQPPLTGDDVRAVQQALKPRPGPQFADGVYDSAT